MSEDHNAPFAWTSASEAGKIMNAGSPTLAWMISHPDDEGSEPLYRKPTAFARMADPTSLSIAHDYEPDSGGLVGANDFSMGHEAGQAFAAERIALAIAEAEATSSAMEHLKAMRGLFDAKGFLFCSGDHQLEVLARVDELLEANATGLLT